MKVLEEAIASAYEKNYLVESAYDHTKWNLGQGIVSETISGTETLGAAFKNIRVMEESTVFAVSTPFKISKSDTEDYIFFVDNGTASATRRVRLYTYNHKTMAVTSNGFITLTLPTATNHTTRDFKVDHKVLSSGTVSASGTAVTGSGTSFSTSGVAVGARIGFGSTDPSQITTWYRVTAIGSDTSITLNVSSGTVAGGSAYVIEEFRPIIITTNATTTNGGLFIAKGVSIEDFSPVGTTIVAATTVDNQKACYWLKDASTETNIVAAGAGIDTPDSQTSCHLYVLDTPSAGNYKVYKYNIRVQLTSIVSGASTSAFVLVTGTQAVTGVVSQNANLSLATAQHGAGNGVKSLYFLTTTRWYRAAASNITSGNVSWQSDNIVETPTGGANTYALLGNFSSLAYLSTIDKFYIATSGNHSYITGYTTSGTQFDKLIGRSFLYLDQSTSDSNHPVMYAQNNTASTATMLSNNSICICKNGSAISNTQAYIMAIGSDWDYANTTEGYLISPEMATADATKYLTALVKEYRFLGANQHTKPTEPFKIYFRTTNITTDATTGWALLDQKGDLSSYSGASTCQFKILFKTIGDNCLPARIISIAAAYTNSTTDTHWAFSSEKSDSATKKIAFRQRTAYGTAYPTLKVQVRDAVSGSILVEDNSVDQSEGAWEKSTDGTTWASYNTTDRTAGSGGDNTYIRFTPTASLPSKVEVSLF